MNETGHLDKLRTGVDFSLECIWPNRRAWVGCQSTEESYSSSRTGRHDRDGLQTDDAASAADLKAIVAAPVGLVTLSSMEVTIGDWLLGSRFRPQMFRPLRSPDAACLRKEGSN